MIEGAFAGVVTTVLTEGIRFLYQQAQELIGSWRAGRTAEATGAPPPEGVFLGEVRLVPDDPAVLDEHAGAFDTLMTSPGLVRLTLGHAVDPDDEDQMRAAAALRALLETVSGRRITFVGEPGRDASGTTVIRGEAEASVLRGLLAGLWVDEIEIQSGARLTGKIKVDELEQGAEGYGVKARKISG
ncbi:hypothetical protein [Streptomyces mirabilis]|uniref:hypothetical protein n=1 Tax=Streptomyces mirabilis TaxID=68239 RepID=UPI003686ED4E